jgi:hypothetical protein
VSVSSLARYRRSLGDFIRTLPMRLEERDGRAGADGGAAPAAEPARRESAEGGLRAIEGGLA